MGLFKQQRGDTIVEVLIALSVLTFVMTIAFASSTRSVENVRGTQERGEALKLAQGQIEHLIVKQGISEENNCFNSNGDAKKAGASNECAYMSVGGSGCDPTTSGYCYNVNIERIHVGDATPTNPSIATTYKVTVVWQGIGGGEDNVNVTYKMYTPNPAYVPPVPPPADPDNPPDDDAVITVNENGPGCTILPEGCPDNATFHYTRSFLFESVTNVTPANTSSCTWNFGDGVTQTYNASAAQCRTGFRMSHTFPEDPAYPEGGHCIRGSNFDKTTYRVTLTINKVSGGSVVSNQQTTTVPYCTGP